MADQNKKLIHLLNRAGFGATPEQMNRFRNTELSVVVKELFKDAELIQSLEYLPKPATNDKGEVSPGKVIVLILRSKKERDELNLAWLDRMSLTKAQLREKMIFFWHNHFATAAPFAWLMQVQHNTLRKHALGNFRDMLHAISKDPAMIIWLNNQQNKKDAPNENFAREVMELFTLGEGNGYTEHDIKEAARAFTGWAVNQAGEFEFNEKQHDFGTKTVFGKTGNFNGEDIINMLLDNPATSKYICRKIYKWFVNNKPDESKVTELATRFYNSGYDIADLMKTLFNSEWFYDEKNIGSVIASPVELIVRLKRLCKLEVEDKQMLSLQDILGQTLFSPPNVAGWKGGRAWIDSSSLLQRLHLPKAILDSGTVRLNRKPAFEEQNNGKDKKEEQVKVKSDWASLAGYFKNISDQQLTDEVIRFLITAPSDRISKAVINAQVDTSTKDRRIITTLSAVMQTPEFQLI